NNQPLLATGLARAYEDMSAQPAGELGLFNTTGTLLEVEEQSILHDRVCELSPFNDYVVYMQRKPLKSMSDITSNKDAQDLLNQLYKSKVGDVEFFIGLFAEDRVPNSPLPRTILSLVAVDAFSQALTNPLLSEHVFKESTFTEYGMNQIKNTASLADILRRNVKDPDQLGFIGMTRQDWVGE
ncbi:MAG: peroxidase family protein, partial [Pseudomonadota bacterium]